MYMHHHTWSDGNGCNCSRRGNEGRPVGDRNGPFAKQQNRVPGTSGIFAYVGHHRSCHPKGKRCLLIDMEPDGYLEDKCTQCGKVDVLDVNHGSICYMCFLVNGEEE